MFCMTKHGNLNFYNRKERIGQNRTVSCGAVIFLFCLPPIPFRLKDGGTVEYRALLYMVSKVHSLTSAEDMENSRMYDEGLIVKLLGFEMMLSKEA